MDESFGIVEKHILNKYLWKEDINIGSNLINHRIQVEIFDFTTQDKIDLLCSILYPHENYLTPAQIEKIENILNQFNY